MDESKNNKLQYTTPIPNNDIINHEGTFASPWTEQYLLFFSKINQLCQLENQSDLQNLLAQKIYYTPFQTNLTMTIVEQSINSQVLVLSLKWGNFNINVQILFVKGQSCTHCQKQKKGTYGNIYFLKILNQSFIVKCVKLTTYTQIKKTQILMLKEFFIAKIASALKIGPTIKKWVGFDLIFYEDCIEFAMEQCLELDTFNKININSQIATALKKLHKFKIFHFDIKPNNIMFSPIQNKAVLIDFGLSQIINVEIGRRCNLSFKGTFNYVSNEMICAFEKGGTNSIDPHYNDVHCLKLTLNQFYSNAKAKTEMNFYQPICYEIQQGQSQSSLLLLLPIIKYHLYHQQILTLTTIFQENWYFIEQKLSCQMLMFFQQLLPTQKLKQFYQQQIKTEKKKGIQFGHIDRIFSSKSIFLGQSRINWQKRESFYSIYKGLLQYRQMDMTLTIQQLIQIMNEHQNFQTQRIFQVYLKSINFLNNITGSTIKEKEELASVFQTSIMEVQLQTGIIGIAATLIFIIKQLASHSQEQVGCLSSPTLANRQSLVVDILAHLFLFDVMGSQQFLQFIGVLYSLYFSTFQDKLFFIYQIKSSSCWLTERIYFKNSIESQKILESLKLWYLAAFVKITQKQEQRGNQVYKIINYFRNLIVYNQINHLDQQNMKQLPIKLRSLIQKSSCQMKQFSSFDQISNNLKGQDQKINWELAINIFYIQLEYYNSQICTGIFKLIEGNLQDEDLLNSFNFRYMMNYLQQNSCQLILYDLLTIFKHIQLISFIIQIQVIYQMLNYIITAYKQKILKHTKITLRQQKAIQEIMTILNIILNICTVQQLFSKQHEVQHEHQEPHYCLARQFVQYLINLWSLLKIDTITFQRNNYSLYCDLVQIRAVSCHNCRFILLNCHYFQLQQICLMRLSRNQVAQQKIELQIIDNYLTIKQLNKTATNINAQIRQQYNLFNIFTMCQLCINNPTHENQYHAIQQLYLARKQLNLLYHYLFYNKSIKYIQVTLHVVHRKMTISEVAYFLKELALYATNMNNTFAMELAVIAFQKIMPQLHQNQLQFLNKQIQNYQLQNPDNICLIFYYYIFMNHINDQQLIQILSKRIINKIGKLPTASGKKLEASYYYFCLNKKWAYQNCKYRKMQFIIKKKLKLFIYLNFNHRKSITIKRKCINFSKIQIMKQKIKQFGGVCKQRNAKTIKLQLKIAAQ